MSVNLIDYSYKFPPELIAQYPLSNREDSKMMVLNREKSTIEHLQFKNFSQFLKKGDVLVLNNSKVFPCRLHGKKKTGGKIECFLIRPLSDESWECLINSASKSLRVGDTLYFDGGVEGCLERADEKVKIVSFPKKFNVWEFLKTAGHIPLPPYIKRPDEASFDTGRYQTVFAEKTGSVAAPTAGFHFTDNILKELTEKGVVMAPLTLHVGLGTFLPIKCENILEHKMHGENFEIPQETADTINRAKKEGRRVFVVGTTAVRALESACNEDGLLKAGMGYTEKFIYPPYTFKIVDHLLTNFHQPCSTLIVLVSTFCRNREWLLKAYALATQNKYRLFSYGDCMMIL